MNALPEPVGAALAEVFEAQPRATAMTRLVVAQPPNPELVRLVEDALRQPGLQGMPALAAGLWLYIDDLDRSHAVSQRMHGATGSWWHAIMHRREGDFMNSQYWYRKTGKHPAMPQLGGFDPESFVFDVSARHRHGPADLVAQQRAEWETLFSWCAMHGG
jgi:hypothetical protein